MVSADAFIASLLPPVSHGSFLANKKNVLSAPTLDLALEVDVEAVGDGHEIRLWLPFLVKPELIFEVDYKAAISQFKLNSTLLQFLSLNMSGSHVGFIIHL